MLIHGIAGLGVGESRPFTISSDAEEGYMLKVAGYVDEKMRAAADSARSIISGRFSFQKGVTRTLRTTSWPT